MGGAPVLYLVTLDSYLQLWTSHFLLQRHVRICLIKDKQFEKAYVFNQVINAKVQQLMSNVDIDNIS